MHEVWGEGGGDPYHGGGGGVATRDTAHIYLEPKGPLFLKVTLKNKALFKQNKGHLGSRYIYIYTWIFLL